MRYASSAAARTPHRALGTLCADGSWPQCRVLSGGLERFQFSTKHGVSVWAWKEAGRPTRVQLLRVVLHDVPLDADYAVILDQSAVVSTGWWDALAPLLARGIDYIGRPGWQEAERGDLERIQAYPWYMGVPPARHDGRPGVEFMREGFIAVRSERLREANFPPPKCSGRWDVLLGEVAQQLGWTRATYDPSSAAATGMGDPGGRAING